MQPVDTEIVATRRNIDEVLSACRLTPLYPRGRWSFTAIEQVGRGHCAAKINVRGGGAGGRTRSVCEEQFIFFISPG